METIKKHQVKKLFLILFIFPIFTQAKYWKDIKKAAEKVNKELIKTITTMRNQLEKKEFQRMEEIQQLEVKNQFENKQ